MITTADVITLIRQQSADDETAAVGGAFRWSDVELKGFIFNSVQRLTSDRIDLFIQDDGTISDYLYDDTDINVDPFGEKPITDYTLHQMYSFGSSDQVDDQKAQQYLALYTNGVR